MHLDCHPCYKTPINTLYIKEMTKRPKKYPWGHFIFPKSCKFGCLSHTCVHIKVHHINLLEQALKN